ncbi:hypothetical protein [Spartinivicinus marinus]|uniref:hypothetical protein n=1 Tax=Spartinivicinus marinus TaxID=2994442 RepID=UPI00225A5B6C|nr:hypothetical protein [Spartinivicinus marinus]MCX4025169.1 hypothetical protein [Spartinivicinus marinus]
MNELTQLHNQMLATLGQHFDKKIDRIQVYSPSQSIESPAIYLGSHELTVEKQQWDGRHLLHSEWFALCVLSIQTPNVDIEIRQFATEIMLVLNNHDKNRWSLADQVSEPKMIQSRPAIFNPDADGYEAWEVSWQQSLYIGDSIWLDEGTPPTTVLCSDAPEIGIPHEDDYRVISR